MQVSNFLDNYVPEHILIDMPKLRKSPDFVIKNFMDSVYIGEMRFMQRDGIGIMKYSNGRVFEGYWEKDKRNGEGYE